MNESLEAFHRMTRGERAGCTAHFLACEACRNWGGLDQEEDAEVLARMSLEDAGDPEFGEVISDAMDRRDGDK